MEITVKDFLGKLLEPATIVYLFTIDDDCYEGPANEAITLYGDYIVEQFAITVSGLEICVSF